MVSSAQWAITSPAVWVLDITTASASTQMFFSTGFPADNSGLTATQAAGLATGLQTAVAALSGVTGCVLTTVAVSSPTATLAAGVLAPTVQATGTGPAGDSASMILQNAQGLLVAFVTRSGGQGSGALTGITDGVGNTWTRLARGAVSGAMNTRIECWAAAAQAFTSALSVNFASTVAQSWAWNVTAWPVTGTVNVDAVSGDNSFAASSTAVATPAITPPSAGDLVLAAGHWPQTTSTLNATGWTALNSFDDGTVGSGRAAYIQPGTSASENAAWTLGTAHTAGVLTVALLGSILGLPQPPAEAPVTVADLVFASSSWASYAGVLSLPGWATSSLQLVTKSPVDSVLTLTQTSAIAAGLQTAAAALTGVSAATVSQQAVTPATV